jgi:HD-GYP domain-containing protein (c-di-GMP phosphodiesterase class II)
MSKKRSLFDQSLDRSVFVTYFLGGVVPFMALAFLSDRVMDTLDERNNQWNLVGLVIAIGVLSLVSFFALRRIVKNAITRMNADNQRLEALLRVARELADAPHAQVVLDATVVWALRIGQADACYVYTRSHSDKTFEMVASRGEKADDWLASCEGQWLDMVEHTLLQGDVNRVEASGRDGFSIVIAPLSGKETTEGALLVVGEGHVFAPAEIDALETLATQAGVALQSAERGDAQRNFFSHMTELVIAALDTHVQYREGHASRVAAIANQVARAMGLQEEQLHDLHFASLMHDVGMLRIPIADQKNPKHYRKHPTVGYKMLSRIRVWEKAAPIVLQHHERIDGGGYPDGLAGDDICLGARILAVCDSWDAMRCDDEYRKALSIEGALAELESHAGTQFDADVVSTFRALVDQGAI